jgi:nitroimidazol reductase NimA-like FMN-containing flavoprotein (pyridoxamine 5'-phosphate oxidase superfamily)
MSDDFKPVLSNEECEKMIEGTYQGVLVMCRDREPYAVPMNHAYQAGRFIFHCAPVGEKLDMIRANPKVAYVVTRYWGRPEDRGRSLKCHGCWESVIARGSARVIEDREELRKAFKRFQAYHGKDSFEPSEKALRETRAIVIDVERMTARRENDKKETEFYFWEKGG